MQGYAVVLITIGPGIELVLQVLQGSLTHALTYERKR